MSGVAVGGPDAETVGKSLTEAGRARVALVGAPNVGKSVLFNRLTGAYVTVANYPGTSVELARGTGVFAGVEAEVADTPGLYSLVGRSEDERVTRRVLLEGEADVLVHVVDTKKLERSLPLTLELLETGLPVVLVLNMLDEAARLGLAVDVEALSQRLGVPVVGMVATRGEGLSELKQAVAGVLGEAGTGEVAEPSYGNGVGKALESVRSRLGGVYPVDVATIASLVLQGDKDAEELMASVEPDGGAGALAAAEEAAADLDGPAAYRVAVERQRCATLLLQGLVREEAGRGAMLRQRLGRWLATPLIGFPVLLLVLYLGFYKLVGGFGAGTLVDWLEGVAFEGYINPWLERLFSPLAWDWLRALFVGEYGLLTLGVRYAIAIVLPIVAVFFLIFAVLEDSGYFPRLALLVDRSFKRIGLSGRAVIPMVLGFACATMATMTTRTLETRRERVLSTMLLALAIPCSAHLGVILGVLSVSPMALAVWAAVLICTFLLVGMLAARLLPGEAASFHMELPPMRWPRARNVMTKTLARVQWYFVEVLPLFLLASVLLWMGDLTGVLGMVVAGLEPVVRALGLPTEMAIVFLFGFFRRDYGAAGLYELNQAGMLDVAQLTVAAVTLTLFVPCVAQFLIMLRERGVKTALGMLLFITPFAFGVGFVLNQLLRGFSW